MIERPILFSAPMVRAILDGHKTQTRRIIKSRSRKHSSYCLLLCENGWWPYLSDDGESSFTDDGMEQAMGCPYGEAGDRLWVKETWGYDQADNGGDRHWKRLVYRADPGAKPLDNGEPTPWTPSIHMPRWASRITLEVTGVRVERVASISEYDAIAEGIDLTDGARPSVTFAKLWDSINGQSSPWQSNPWVWVVEFRLASS